MNFALNKIDLVSLFRLKELVYSIQQYLNFYLPKEKVDDLEYCSSYKIKCKEFKLLINKSSTYYKLCKHNGLGYSLDDLSSFYYDEIPSKNLGQRMYETSIDVYRYFFDISYPKIVSTFSHQIIIDDYELAEGLSCLYTLTNYINVALDTFFKDEYLNLIILSKKRDYLSLLKYCFEIYEEHYNHAKEIAKQFNKKLTKHSLYNYLHSYSELNNYSDFSFTLEQIKNLENTISFLIRELNKLYEELNLTSLDCLEADYFTAIDDIKKNENFFNEELLRVNKEYFNLINELKKK